MNRFIFIFVIVNLRATVAEPKCDTDSQKFFSELKSNRNEQQVALGECLLKAGSAESALKDCLKLVWSVDDECVDCIIGAATQDDVEVCFGKSACIVSFITAFMLVFLA